MSQPCQAVNEKGEVCGVRYHVGVPAWFCEMHPPEYEGRLRDRLDTIEGEVVQTTGDAQDTMKLAQDAIQLLMVLLEKSKKGVRIEFVKTSEESLIEIISAKGIKKLPIAIDITLKE